MHHTGDILLGTLGLVVILAGIGWMTWQILRRSHEPVKLVIRTVASLIFGVACLLAAGHAFIFGPFVIVFMGIVFSIVWTPQIAEWISSPLTSLFTGSNEAPDDVPLYSSAYAKRKRGQPVAAIAEVRAQLAKFPNDFEGVTLLAQILAEDMADLPGAEIALRNFCNARNVGPRQVFAALNLLADFHLKLSLDEDAARAALQEIVTRFPDTELALQTQERLGHLHGAAERLIAQHDPQAVPVPEGIHNLGLRGKVALPQPKEIAPLQQARDYLAHLQLHPRDAETREKLALLYARDLQRLDLATMELEQLLAEPHHPAKRICEWLNQLATYQVELGTDPELPRQTLSRITEKYPGSPAAEVAERRLARLNLDFKGRQTTSEVKMGEYEQRLGLKYGRPGEGGKRPV